MYDMAARRRALTHIDEGRSLSETSRATGISRSTLRDWASRRTMPARATCLRDEFPPGPYTYLLGLYLGDGCISPSRRGVYAMRIACADAWPGLIDACERALWEVAPASRVCRAKCQGCTSVVSYSKHWPCLFPQAGPGPKHARRIELAEWQARVVREHPWELIRGLIHSDGSRFTNWATSADRRYEYPRYVFTNKSDDIRAIFTGALDQVGVGWTTTRRRGIPYNVSIARHASVALMDAHVGPKH